MKSQLIFLLFKSEMLQLRLRDGTLFTTLYLDVHLAPPKKGDRVLVVGGKHLGKQGTVRQLVSNDVVVDFNGQMEVIKLSLVAWMEDR